MKPERYLSADQNSPCVASPLLRLAVCFGKKDLSSFKQKSSVERALASDDDNDFKLASKQHCLGLQWSTRSLEFSKTILQSLIQNSTAEGVLVKPSTEFYDNGGNRAKQEEDVVAQICH